MTSGQKYPLHVLYKMTCALKNSQYFPHLDAFVFETVPSVVVNQAPYKSFIVQIDKLESISKLTQSVGKHLRKDVTMFEPAPSFAVHFYWTVKTSGTTHQSVHCHLYRPKSNLKERVNGLSKFCCWRQ